MFTQSATAAAKPSARKEVVTTTSGTHTIVLGIGRDANTKEVNIWMAIHTPRNWYQWWQQVEGEPVWELLWWRSKFKPQWVLHTETVTTTTTVVRARQRITVQEKDIECWHNLLALKADYIEDPETTEELKEMPSLEEPRD